MSVGLINFKVMSFSIDNEAPSLLKEHGKNTPAYAWGFLYIFFLTIQVTQLLTSR